MSPGLLRISAVILLAAGAAGAAEEYRVYTDSPRLFLRARRLRLLKRERQRDSMRWRQFQALMSRGGGLPEPAFSTALYAAITEEPDAVERAASEARKTQDARQAAIAFDWLHEALSPEDAKALAGKLRAALENPVSTTDIAAVRTRTLAAIAISDVDPALSEKTLRWVVQDWWRGKIAPGLRMGAALIRPDEVFALYELMHAVRDNLTVDLREDAGEWFKNLPGRRLLGYYPAPYKGADNEFRIPAFSGAGAPNLERAAMSRVTELEMVAYDPNAPDSQFLQGWLMQDRFLLRGSLGAPYEFLWANPYQPGLSYYHFPLIHHAQASGDLFVRSSWDDDARWFGVVNGELQYFDHGNVTVLDPARQTAPLEMGSAAIAFAKDPAAYEDHRESAGPLFVLRLMPRATYQVKFPGERAQDVEADATGALELELKAPGKLSVRLKR
jgi:hypothetical protein